MTTTRQPTFHAPPERLASELISQQAAELGNLGGLTALLHCMPDWVMLLNEQRQIIFGNKALRDFTCERGGTEMLGLRPGELLDCRQAGLAPSGCGTGLDCRTCGMVNAVLAGLDGGSVMRECRISTPTLGAYDLRVWASPFQWEGEGNYVLVIAVDISDEKRREVLERIFFHDILNTAGSVYGLSDLLRQDPGSVSELKDDLYETAETLVQEIQAQRLLLQAEQNDLPVTLAPADSQRVLDSVFRAYRQHSLAKGKTIRMVPDAAISFRTDEGLLHRVLGNVVKNALEASQVGETVEFGAQSRDGRIVFWCHNPLPIPPEIQRQLFQRSFSTKGKGRGIGTYSIRLLTERYLSGKVTLTSNPETGTRFEIALPLAVAG